MLPRREPPLKRENRHLRAALTWNVENPVGTEVIVTRDNGDELRTKTRSEAWVLSEHTAVVMVEGIAGGYLLSRVRRAPPNHACSEGA